MKKSLCIVLSLIVFIQLNLMVGCGKKKKDPNAVTNYLKELKSYSCKTEIIVKNQKKTYTYETNQFYKKGYGARLEIDNERIYIYCNNNIYVKDQVNNLSYIMDKNYDGIFRLSLIEEYIALLYTNESIKYKYKNIDGQEYQLMETYIPGNDRNMNKADLYVNKKTKIPKKLYIYDWKGQERTEIIYKNFNSNVEVSEDLFDINAVS